VVGVLVLVAMVTVVSAGNISVPSGATAMTAPKVSAERVLFECSGGEVYFVDEDGNGKRVQEEVKRAREHAPPPPQPSQPERRYYWNARARERERQQGEANGLVAILDGEDVGDATYRIRAESMDRGLAWVYTLRSSARGERLTDLDRPEGAFQKQLAALGRGGFAYFVVHDDSFEVFRKARDLARARGISVGWHPVEGQTPLRLSAIGSLGKRIQ
jgi:hypothetical protein